MPLTAHTITFDVDSTLVDPLGMGEHLAPIEGWRR